MNHYNIPNLLAAIILSSGIIFGWQYFYEKPRLAKLAEEQKKYHQQIEETKKEQSLAQTASINENAELIKRVAIKSELLNGSIAIKGLRFDNLTLLGYKQDLSSNSKDVELFSPTGTDNAYFAEIGWLSNSPDIVIPTSETQWVADSSELSTNQPVNFSWANPNGLEFRVNITLDNHYLFTIKQIITNKSGKDISLQNYGLINRNYASSEKAVNILHQGPIAVIEGQLKEYSYDDIKDKKMQQISQSIVDWIGITDKYWLAAFVPDQAGSYSSNVHYALKGGKDKFQIDFVSPNQLIRDGESLTVTHRLFAGAKKVDLLDKYEKQNNIRLFDRAIDFGWFYILTKPVFNALSFFYRYVGNFGVSILIVTVLIKLLMFTLANKSYRAMKRMKKLQPEIERIKTLYKDNKTKLNQEIMELYRREKVNPVSGCLPLFVQIPVFFSLYKVLYVTIEMRHAPFFGWIQDLSAPDPTSIFNLFGLLPFTPPSFLMIGIWPIFMAITMFLQQTMSPPPADPVQAQVMKLMPLIFLVMFSSFPAGLLIYWSWNNILSIIQQYYINKLDKS